MIIATIGGDAFAIDSLHDAHGLLEILNRARPVEEGTVSKSYDRRYFVTEGFRRDVEIKIVAHDLLTATEFKDLCARNGVTA